MSAYAATHNSQRAAKAPASTRAASALMAFARGRVEAYRKAREARKAYRHVMAMTDYQLRDIGLSRAEVKARVFGAPSSARSILD